MVTHNAGAPPATNLVSHLLLTEPLLSRSKLKIKFSGFLDGLVGFGTAWNPQAMLNIIPIPLCHGGKGSLRVSLKVIAISQCCLAWLGVAWRASLYLVVCNRS